MKLNLESASSEIETVRDLRTAIEELAQAEYERASAVAKSFLARERIKELTYRLTSGRA